MDGCFFSAVNGAQQRNWEGGTVINEIRNIDNYGLFITSLVVYFFFGNCFMSEEFNDYWGIVWSVLSIDYSVRYLMASPDTDR